MSSERVVLCPDGELGDSEARRFDVEVGGLVHRIAVIRVGDDLYALGDTCSHDDYSLAEGEVDAEEGTIECWKHGSLFNLSTGEAETLPAIRPVPVYDVGVEDGQIWLEVGHDE
ncbi:non-heme iron oxygenase ferredoxin subunit [Candidatus Poriferisocius sp.]|uniref:non-heme iron oxygenase ferredoxin subunit n=1 Tax=Candidatus Poriferisocius sp. TaxID=3101276 RepID=UPI003B01348B